MSTVGPVFGWDAPHKTASECEDPAFADANAHRVYIVPVEFYVQGIPGFRTKKKCVQCGRLFEHDFFYTLPDVKDHYPAVLDTIGFDQSEWVETAEPSEDPRTIDYYTGYVQVEVDPIGDSTGPSPDYPAIVERLENALKLIELFAQESTDDDGLDELYRIAHTARAPSCFDSHTDWEDQFQTLIDEYLEDDTSDPVFDTERCVHCDQIMIGDPGYHHATNHPDKRYDPLWYMEDDTSSIDGIKQSISD